MLNDPAKSQPYPLSISILCGIFTGCFTALQTSYISDIIVDYTLLSKPSCPNFYKYHHHSPTCSSRHLGVLPDFCLLFAVSASNPSANAKQVTFRSFNFPGPDSHRATVTLCPDPYKNSPTAGLTSLPAPSSPLPKCSQEQCVKGVTQSQSLHSHSLTDFVLYLKENPSSGMICPSLHLQSLGGPLPLGHKASGSSSHSSGFSSDILFSDMTYFTI